MTFIYILIISFSLGLFKNELVTLFNKLLTLFNIKLSNKIMNYFHVFTNTFSLLLKYLFYLSIIYTLFNCLNLYINFDETFINNMAILSFDDLDNLAKTVNDPNLNNTYNNNPSIPYNQIFENMPNAIGATGAYHTAMKVSEHVPTIPGKIFLGAVAAGFTATGVSFGMTLGENLAKQLVKDKTKNNFIQYFISPLDKHTQYPYDLLSQMFLLNSFAVSILIIVFNITIVNYIKNKNILQYLPEFIKSSKMFIIIEYFYNRYIRIWNISSKYILIIAYTIIITDILLIHLGLYCILFIITPS